MHRVKTLRFASLPVEMGHSMQTNDAPIRARWKSGAGHEALQMAPVHVGSVERGTT